MDTPVTTGSQPRLLGVSFSAESRQLIVQFNLELAPDEPFAPSPSERTLMERAIAGLRQQRHVIPYLTAAPHWIDDRRTQLCLGEVTSGRSRVVQQLDWMLYLLQTRPVPPPSP
jgi:hypothetical protein